MRQRLPTLAGLPRLAAGACLSPDRCPTCQGGAVNWVLRQEVATGRVLLRPVICFGCGGTAVYRPRQLDRTDA